MSWSLADAYEVLAVAQSFDRRTVGDFDAASWVRAIGELNLDDAKQAVIDHYATSTDWLMPGHVRAGVNRIRANRLDRSIDAVPDADPDDPIAYQQALREGRSRTADGIPAQPERVQQAITGTFPSPPPLGWRPELPPRPAPHLAGLPPVDDAERMAQARAEVAARQPVVTEEPEPADA